MAHVEDGTQNSRSKPQLKPHPPSSRPLQASANEVKDMAKAAHDFLSLAGSKNSYPISHSAETQDLLQPFESSRVPSTCGLVSHVVPMGAEGAGMECALQQSSYAVANGALGLGPDSGYKAQVEGPMEGKKERLENFTHLPGMQPKFRLSELGYFGKLPQGIPLPVANAKALKVSSVEGKNEDDEFLDQSCNSEGEMTCFLNSDLSLKSEGKTSDLKASTSRSKHSATEQRRRSKINDRFQMLKQLLPNADQKMDKATFLFEVIGYIQMLQEKVKKYENDEQRRVQEKPKANPWDAAMNSTCRDSTASSVYFPLPSGVTLDAKEFGDSNGYLKKISSPLRVTSENDGDLISHQGLVFQTCLPQGSQAGVFGYQETNMTISKPLSLTPSSIQHVPSERVSIPSFPPTAGFSLASQPVTEASEMSGLLVKYDEHQSVVEAKSTSSKLVEGLLQTSNAAGSIGRLPDGGADLQNHDTETNHLLDFVEGDSKQIGHSGESLEDDNVDREPLVVHGGSIKISSRYSENLLDAVARALQSAGIDLTQASISVQIDLVNPNGVMISSPRKATSPPQATEIAEIEHTRKRLRTEADG